MNWTLTWGTHTTVYNPDLLAENNCIQRTTERLEAKIGRYMHNAGAVPVEPATVKLTPSIFTSDIVIHATQRGIVLRHPNPMPDFDLFPRARRIWKRLTR